MIQNNPQNSQISQIDQGTAQKDLNQLETGALRSHSFCLNVPTESSTKTEHSANPVLHNPEKNKEPPSLLFDNQIKTTLPLDKQTSINTIRTIKENILHESDLLDLDLFSSELQKPPPTELKEHFLTDKNSISQLKNILKDFKSNALHRITVDKNGNLTVKMKGITPGSRRTISKEAAVKLIQLLDDIPSNANINDAKLQNFINILNENKSILKQRALNKLSEMGLSPIVAKEIQDIVKISIKNLKSGEGKEYELANLKEHNIVILKDSQGKLDILVKGKFLAAGGAGKVFLSYSSRSNRTEVLKQPLGEEGFNNEENVKEMKHESNMLEILGPHEGIQESVKFIKTKNGKGIESGITIAKYYSQGDLTKHVIIEGIAKGLGLSSSQELFEIKDDVMDKKIADKFPDCSINEEVTKNDINNMSLAKAFIEKKIGSQDNVLPHDKDIGNKFNTCIMSVLGANSPIDKEKIESLINEYLKDVRTATKNSIKNYIADVGAKKFEHVDTSKRMEIGAKLISGLQHVHSKGMVHNDIKPQNIFGETLADFGAAVLKNDIGTASPTGTPGYDLYASILKKYDAKNIEQRFKVCQADDQRAMGLTIYQLITGGTIPNRLNYKLPESYSHMEQDLLNKGVSKTATNIILKMCKPMEGVDLNSIPVKVPEDFPIPVTDVELSTLMSELKNKNV